MNQLCRCETNASQDRIDDRLIESLLPNKDLEVDWISLTKLLEGCSSNSVDIN